MVQCNRTQLLEKLKANQVQRQLSVRDFAEVIGVSERWLYLVYAFKKKPGTKILDFMGMEERRTVLEVYVTRKRKKVVDINPQISV